MYLASLFSLWLPGIGGCFLGHTQVVNANVVQGIQWTIQFQKGLSGPSGGLKATRIFAL